jgi:DNA-binding transcriptional LysR family regulator
MKFQYLKLNQLRFADALRRQGRLGLAAEELHMSQPAASRMLAEIEGLVGQPICSRNAHGVVFNELGQALAARAHRVIHEIDQLRRDLTELVDGSHGKVRIGAVTTAAVGYALPAAIALRRLAPRMELQIDVEPSVTLMQRMRAGDYDFVLGRLTRPEDRTQFDVRPIGEEAVKFVVREGHPLTGCSKLRLADLTRQDWVIQPVDTPIWSALSRAFLDEQTHFPESVTYTASVLLTLATISRTDAIAPLADDVFRLLASPALTTRLAILDMANPIFVPDLSVITLRDSVLSPIALRLLKLIDNEIAAKAAGGFTVS